MIIQKDVFLYMFILQSMREVEMYYVDVQKESIDKGVDAILLEGAKNSPSYIYNNTSIYAIRIKIKRPMATHGHSTSV